MIRDNSVLLAKKSWWSKLGKGSTLENTEILKSSDISPVTVVITQEGDATPIV